VIQQKNDEMVSCPEVTVAYEKYKGGADLLNSLTDQYKIIMKSK
jgi:hypothetical protein